MPNDRDLRPPPGTPSTPRSRYERVINRLLNFRRETEAEHYARIQRQEPNYMGSGFQRFQAAIKARLFRVKPPATQPVAPESSRPSPVATTPLLKEGNSRVTRTQILDEAAKWEGTPYGHGKQAPGVEADCSGSVLAIYKSLGLHIALGPNIYRSSAQAIANSNTLTTVINPQPGDIVYWEAPFHHTMIYAGSGMVWGASRPGKPFGFRKESDYGTEGRVRISSPKYFRHPSVSQ